MGGRLSNTAALAAAVVALGAGAAPAGASTDAAAGSAPAASRPAGDAGALVARSTRVTGARSARRLPLRRAERLLRRTLRRDGYSAIGVSCDRRAPRRVKCAVHNAASGGASWSGEGLVVVRGRATTITYRLESGAA
jgi:hypothetical protein